MYRYIAAASNFASMFNEFDLEDFGNSVASSIARDYSIRNIAIESVKINQVRNNEYIYLRAEINGQSCTAMCKLDSRRIRKPRDLITNYVEPVVAELVDQCPDAVFSASYSMEQEFTSKQTAGGNGNFNKGKGRVPALFKKIHWVPNTLNFDYGCGYKSTQERIAEFLADKGVEYVGFDKFNQTAAEQAEAWDIVDANNGADTVTCANVLNVVKERNVRVDEIIANIYDALKPGGIAYFDVYEGDKSSAGRQTGKDSYQLTRPVDGYVEEIEEIFGEGNVQRKGKLIIARK